MGQPEGMLHIVVDDIAFCPLHQAAPAMREALRLLHNEVQRSGQLGVNAPLRFADEQADKTLTLAEQTP